MKLSLFRLRILVLVGWVVLVGSVYLVKDPRIGSVLSASSPWTQTDWSGGTASGTVNSTVTTYESESSIDAGTAGQFNLDSASGWAGDYGSWAKRQAVTITNSGSLQTNYQVRLSITYDSDMQTDFDDLRFTNSSGDELDYWIEKKVNNTSSVVWVEIDTLEGSTDTVIYMYYSNPSSITTSDGDATFIFFDTFDTQDSSKFLYNQSFAGFSSQLFSISGGLLTVYSNGNWRILRMNRTFSPSDNIAVRTRFIYPASSTWHQNFLVSSNGTDRNRFGLKNVSGNEYQAQYRVNGVGYSQSSTLATLSTNTYYQDEIQKISSTQFQAELYDDTGVQTGISYSQTQAGWLNENWTWVNWQESATAVSYDWILARKILSTEPTISFGSAESKYATSGTLTSNIFDSGVAMDWGLLSYTSSGAGTVTVKVRTDNSSNMSGATAWGTCTAITNGTDISTNNCVDDGDRYIQYLVTLQPSGGSAPVFEDISIAFVPSDGVPPDVNASLFEISGLAQSGDWYKDEATITWSEGSDDDSGNGILGYCISLDEADQGSSHGLNPQNVAGVLAGKDDGVSQNYCPFIVRGNSFDISTIPSLNLVSGKEYFFSIKAVDLAGNIYTGTDETWKDVISFRYDNKPPTAPFYISLPANFLSSKDVVITWPVGVGGADDIDSGLAGLQYRIGESGIWYGDLHTGTQDINDLLVNDGSYVTDETYDYPVLLEGNNLVYFRAIDNVGNVTLSENYVKGVIKLNTVAPSPVRNLSVSPTNSETNAYSFEWDIPVTYTGSSSGITYCYAINTIPSESTCTFTQAGVTQLSTDAFATQPGTNTMYIVARDEAGNINYATYSEPGSSVSFTYSGTAPGIPQNLDVADISVKSTANWRLVLSWDKPTNVGAGISYYNIYRSTTSTSCSGGISGFSKMGSSTSTSYIDPDLEQKNYYYCIKACDSANNCSASSGTIGKLPTGKYTTPAELLSAPEVVNFTTRKAVISWVTDRVSDSSIEYGLKSGEYFEAEVANSNQLAAHTIPLNNLEPGTTYYYRAKWTDVDGNTGVSEEKTFATLPPPLVSNVTVSNITTNSVVINFKVINSVDASILYGLTEGYGGVKVVSTSLAESNYTTQLVNLTEGSQYNFKFNLRDIDNNTYTYFENHQFSTLPFPQIKDIQIEEVKNTSQPTVNIFWKSNVPISSLIRFSPQDNMELKRDQIDLEMQTEHTMEIVGLMANTKYVMVVSGRDILGNEAISEEYQFTTDEDSRPPVISNIKVETRMSTGGTPQNQAQLIVSWDTDESATSQIEYGEGSSGEYTQKTLVDDNASFNHLVIINNLRPSSVYHLRVLSKDSAGNQAEGRNMVTISAQLSENPLDIIISRLTEAFGFIR